MHSLHALTPLGHQEPQVKTIGGFTISEVMMRAMASVAARAGHDKAARKTIAKLIDAPVPEAGQWTGSMTGPGAASKLSAFWMGRGQWMLEAPMKNHEDIVATIEAEFNGKASLTEQSDGWCRFEISGKSIDRLCSLLCAIDTRGFTQGSAIRTSIEHIGCFVLRLSGTKIHILGPRSSAESLHHGIVAAMKSVPF